MKRRSPSKLLPITPDLVSALAEVMPIGGGEAPVAVTGWPGPLQHLKKVVAEYPNGWRLQINLNRLGRVTSSSANFKLVAAIGGKSPRPKVPA